MKKYNKPSLEEIKVESVNVIATSIVAPSFVTNGTSGAGGTTEYLDVWDI